MEVIQLGKVPIVVPRRHELGEHVDNHQLEISRKYKECYNSILLVEQMYQLGDYLEHYDELVKDLNKNGLPSNNAAFCKEFSKIIDQLLA